jgi:hypothetical protein
MKIKNIIIVIMILFGLSFSLSLFLPGYAYNIGKIAGIIFIIYLYYIPLNHSNQLVENKKNKDDEEKD